MTVQELRARQAELRRVLEAYDLVSTDLAPHLSRDSVTRHTLGFHRQCLATKVKFIDTEIETLQSKCGHALELIGEASPPVWRCVYCQLVRPCPG